MLNVDLLADLKLTGRLERQLKDYASIGLALILQRQGIFFASAALSAFFFNPWISLLCYTIVLISEVYDYKIFRKIINWKSSDQGTVLYFLRQIIFNTIVSSAAICFFVIAIAYQEGVGTHFTPLFFLFAAALFAAMNNHQLVPILFLRLAIYGCTFIFIPLRDLLIAERPIDDTLWLQFLTVIFVLYFLIDCAFIYLRLYRNGLNQLEALKAEHEVTTEALRTKSQFLSTVSHELRTPLTAIKSSMDLVNSNVLGEAPATMKPVLEIVGRNSHTLSALINDLLELQSLEAGKAELDFKATDIGRLVQDAAESVAPIAEKEGVTFAFKGLNDGLIVNADPRRLSQVATNIISNAITHSSSGQCIEIAVESERQLARITVTDSGPGISHGMKDIVFGQFSQIDSSDERAHGGTGLGLNISEKIVDMHGGRIDYNSTLGKGTTFFVELPVVPPQQRS